jgi:hypothetical protein
MRLRVIAPLVTPLRRENCRVPAAPGGPASPGAAALTSAGGHGAMLEGCGRGRLVRQRDHARDHGQTDRAELFTTIIERVEGQP